MATRHREVVVICGGLSGLYVARLTVSAIANGDQIGCSLLQCMSPLLAQSGHRNSTQECPLLGVKRTSGRSASMSAYEPPNLPSCTTSPIRCASVDLESLIRRPPQ